MRSCEFLCPVTDKSSEKPEMKKSEILEPTKLEKDHIFQLVKRAGKKIPGTVISDVAGLHKWAGVTNGFDARFLAMYYECKLQIPSYSDPELAAKLEGWLAWYRKRVGKVNPTGATKTATPQFVPKEDLHAKQPEWDHECLACDGFGTIEPAANVSEKCNFCGGTGWMSNTQHESFQKKFKVSYSGNQWQHMSHDDSWKKSRIICSVCDGDGGASGQCYKCGGTGWLLSDK